MSEGELERTLRAGPLTLLLAEGEPRYLRLGSVELLRRIHTTVRDRSWGTVEGRLQELRLDETHSGFDAHCVRQYRCGEIDFIWQTTIAGRELGGGVELHFTAIGEACSTFHTNRTGICVLHPLAGCAGRACTIEHTDGTVEQSQFPTLVAAHQPFTNIRAITHEPSPGLRVEVRFEGDVFEMEDHRNWTDASFKTYCRPLSQPFPYVIERGQRIEQRVKVRVTTPRSMPSSAGDVIELRLGGIAGRLPAIGLCANTPSPIPQIIRRLNLSHLRINLTPEQDYPRTDSAIPVEIALHLKEPDEDIAAVIQSTARSNNLIARCVVYETGKPFASLEAVAAVKAIVSKRWPNIPVGGGTIGNFAEANRARSVASKMDVLAYPVNPQMHASDDLTLIENLEGQGDSVRTARQFAPHAHIAVGPVTMHRRADPFAAGRSGEIGAELDEPRQRSQLGALWTLGSIKHLAEAGADSISCFDISGPLGVLGEEGPYPLFYMFQSVGEFAGGQVVACTSSMPLVVDALALSLGGRTRLLISNFSSAAQRVVIDGKTPLLLNPHDIRTLDLSHEAHP